MSFGEIIATPAPILSKFASKPFPSSVFPWLEKKKERKLGDGCFE
jgi:hypothetical protein